MENVVKMLPKPLNKYSVNIVIKRDEHMLLKDFFNFAYVFKNSIQTISKRTQVSRAAGLENLYWRFLEDGKSLSKRISDLCDLPITSEKFPNSN